MHSDNHDQVRRLAALGKPITFDYPGKDGDKYSPIVAAVNAARETGMASLLYDYGGNPCRHEETMRHLEMDENVRTLREALQALSLTEGELEAVTNVPPYTEERAQVFVRIDVVCTDHPSQQKRRARADADKKEKDA